MTSLAGARRVMYGSGLMPMSYRRKWGSSIWHSSPACSNWPSELLSEERPTEPAGALCAECDALQQLDAPAPPPEPKRASRGHS